ncbi:hypothetical protein NDU88_005596 [Pleurodeles waltl]|uniref:Uncharacterized protein n=1 Tax=Pleurodeles waltl TaxID=8319 RepID=A0AAV7N0N9_PLEWA|nr:hypothetical protein NDU88_005596 [Pleurodeles waltl]
MGRTRKRRLDAPHTTVAPEAGRWLPFIGEQLGPIGAERGHGPEWVSFVALALGAPLEAPCMLGDQCRFLFWMSGGAPPATRGHRPLAPRLSCRAQTVATPGSTAADLYMVIGHNHVLLIANLDHGQANAKQAKLTFEGKKRVRHTEGENYGATMNPQENEDSGALDLKEILIDVKTSPRTIDDILDLFTARLDQVK